MRGTRNPRKYPFIVILSKIQGRPISETTVPHPTCKPPPDVEFLTPPLRYILGIDMTGLFDNLHVVHVRAADSEATKTKDFACLVQAERYISSVTYELFRW